MEGRKILCRTTGAIDGRQGALGSGPRYQILSHVFALCASENLRPRDSRMAVGTRFSHGRRFFDSRNVQKSVTQIIYLGPLPRGHYQWFHQRVPERAQGTPATGTVFFLTLMCTFENVQGSKIEFY